jgi:putative two-component system response regulator
MTMNTLNQATILVVDDVPENIDVIAGTLRKHYRVIFAINGGDALELARTQAPDLVLLDIMMPEMDGYEVCRRMKEDIKTRDIPVIFLTALSADSDEQRGLELGAVDFLHKPCNPAIVRQRVRIHLDLRDQNQALEIKVRERTTELDQTRLEIVRRLGRAAEYRDNETGMHVIRMSHSARLLALAVGVPESQAELLLNAAPMHDVGKIGIPDRILLKPGRLAPEEWAIMQTHTTIGAEIIGDHPSKLLRMARTVALAHHERWDGSGYPNGLAGEAIPLEGRIVTVADVFDALTSERPYKRAWSSQAATDYIRSQAGKAFDPGLVQVFIGLIPEVLRMGERYADAPATTAVGTGGDIL